MHRRYGIDGRLQHRVTVPNSRVISEVDETTGRADAQTAVGKLLYLPQLGNTPDTEQIVGLKQVQTHIENNVGAARNYLHPG